MDKGGGGEKFLNLETVKYELQVLVISNNGDSINLFPELKAYDDAKRESSASSPMYGFQTTPMPESDKIMTSNKLLQFVPVEVIGDVKSVLLEWAFGALDRFPLEIFAFEDVQELRIQSLPINLGPHLRHLPPEIGDLKNLRILEILLFRDLEDLPSEIGSLENLEVLDISYCDSLLHLPSEIGNLKRLQRLDISWCSKLQDLPSTIGNLKSLEELSMKICDNLKHIPSEMGDLKSLRKLNISSIASTRLNGTEGFRLGCTNLVNLQEMRIFSCERLFTLPQEIGNLRCLRKLLIKRCNDLENLPSEIGNLESLQEMMIIDCPRINDLPPEIGNLRLLRKLERRQRFGSITKLHTIPLEVGNLLSLQELNISYSGCLEHLALVISKLEHHLERLNINYDNRCNLNHVDQFSTSFTGRVIFDVEFTMTLVELKFRLRIQKAAKKIENLNNFLQSLAAETSPSSPTSFLLPQGIQCIQFDESRGGVSQRKINQETIYKLLQKYPTIGRICSFRRRIPYYLTADTLHMMYLNRFGRSLKYKVTTSDVRSPPTLLAGNVWPIILEEAQTSIRNGFIDIAKRTTFKNSRAISASVIYSIIRELALPLLIDH